MTEKKLESLEFTTGILTLIFTFIGGILFAFSYSTNYYSFGSGFSVIILALIALAAVFTATDLIFTKKNPDAFWVKLLTFGTTACLAAAALLLIGDRVEGIGNTIVTDYDSGHGGEQAIYLSIAGSLMMLIGMVLNIIGSFSGKEGVDPEKIGKRKGASIIGSGIAGAVVMIALVSVLGLGGSSGSGAAGTASGGDTYTVSFNQANGNTEDMPSYQFLCSDFSGMVAADSRFYVDVTLSLGSDGTYTLNADSYVIESGARAVVGDDTGLGLVLTTNATGTYTDNGDGTVTTSVPESAVFEMETDTYSMQMKAAAGMAVGDSDEDGVYDSSDYPEVLDFVPETIFTLSDGAIVTWDYANPEDDPANQTDDAEEAEEEDAAEDSAAAGGSAVFESTDGSTKITFNADGTYVFEFPDYNVEDPGTYTYDGTTLVVTNESGDEVTADGDPLTFTYVSSLSDALTGEFSIDAATLSGLSGGASEDTDASGDAEDSSDSDATAEGSETLSGTFDSDDGSTKITFNDDGTYVFEFPDYNVEDPGTYTYDGTTLVVTNANGDEVTADGDPLTFTYVSSLSDALTGDFTISK